MVGGSYFMFLHPDKSNSVSSPLSESIEEGISSRVAFFSQNSLLKISLVKVWDGSRISEESISNSVSDEQLMRLSGRDCNLGQRWTYNDLSSEN